MLLGLLVAYLYSLTRHFFLAESVLVADPEQGVSRTEGRLSRGKSKEFAPAILAVTINGPVWLQGRSWVQFWDTKTPCM